MIAYYSPGEVIHPGKLLLFRITYKTDIIVSCSYYCSTPAAVYCVQSTIWIEWNFSHCVPVCDIKWDDCISSSLSIYAPSLLLFYTIFLSSASEFIG